MLMKMSVLFEFMRENVKEAILTPFQASTILKEHLNMIKDCKFVSIMLL